MTLPRERRRTARQKRQDRNNRYALVFGLVGCLILAVGAYFLAFEMTPGLDHRQHPCHLYSWLAVNCTFAGLTLVLVAGWALIWGDD